MGRLHTSMNILVVDDEKWIRQWVVDALRTTGHNVESVANAQQAMERMEQGGVDCCLVDIMMPPGMTGLELLTKLNKSNPDTPVIIMTGASSIDNAVEALRSGAYDFLTKPVEDPFILIASVERALEKRRLSLEARWSRSNLEQEVREKTRELAIRNRQLSGYAVELEDMTVNIVASMLVAMEAKDPYTAGHSTRVRQFAMTAGRAMGLPDEDLVVLDRAAMLHDIGKLIIEVSSISKPGPLSDTEWEKILLHPEVGDKMLEPFSFLKKERSHIRHHHERFDGKGYPDGISGNQIPLLTEILSVADSFDAMTSKRAYRSSSDWNQACQELERSVGTQFSNQVVPRFLKAVNQSRNKRKVETSTAVHY